MRIAKPAANRYRVLRVEDITGRRVVDDDCLFEIPSHLTEIFYIIALVVVATLAEESVVHNVVYVELIQQWVSVFGDGCREHHHFVKFSHTFEKCVYAWAFDDVYIVVLAFNFHGYGKVCLMEDL